MFLSRKIETVHVVAISMSDQFSAIGSKVCCNCFQRICSASRDDDGGSELEDDDADSNFALPVDQLQTSLSDVLRWFTS